MEKLLKKWKFLAIFVVTLILFSVTNVYAEETIDNISITGLKKPVIGETVGENIEDVKVPNDANYSIIGCSWWGSEDGMYYGNMIDSNVFEKDLYYEYQITLKAKEGFDFLFDENGDFVGSLSTSSVDYILTQQDNPGELLIVGKPILLLENDDYSYLVTEGAGQVYTIGESTELKFSVDANQKAFDGHIIYIDGVEFDWENYEYETNNTSLILPKNYLDTLSIGEHTLKFEFVNDKETETTFTIAKKSESSEEYKVIEGADQKYVINNNQEARFRINAEYSLFENGGKVFVDDKEVAPEDYTAEKGSTIITLKKNYLDTLSEGDHTLKVLFNDNKTATTTFTIAKQYSALEVDNPKTGDGIMSYLFMLISSILGFFGTFIARKKLINR